MSHLNQAVRQKRGGTIFAYWVKNPTRYGVVSFDQTNHATQIVEKPKNPPSNYAVPGLYFYDNRVCDIAAGLTPSARGEYEITDVNQTYLDMGELNVVKLGRGIAWLDTGTYESLVQAHNFVQAIEQRQGLKIACLEEIAFEMGYISKTDLNLLAERSTNEYGEYLKNILTQQDLPHRKK